MKKIILVSGLMLAALALTNCAKEQAIEEPVVKEGIPFELVISPDLTKTTAEDLSSIQWVANDGISVFHVPAGETTASSANDKFTIASEDLATNKFKGELTNALSQSNDWYAFYPYGSYITPSGEGYVSVGGNMTQDFANPMAHLAGTKFPLYGKATDVDQATVPSITMHQAMSILKVHVTNNSGAALDISSITFATDDYDITGQFYINFEGDSPVFTPKSGSTGKNVKLTVSNSTPLLNGASADYFIAVAPFEAASGKSFSLKVNNFQKGITLSSSTSFLPGKFKKINFNYDLETKKATLPFSIDGTGGSAAYSSTDGLSASGLGSDYAASNSPYLTKFDSTGDFIQLYYDVPADKVNFEVKKIGGATNSKFYLTGSADGVTFNDIETFEIKGAQNTIVECTSSETIDPTYRYLRLTFDKGQNVGLGKFNVTLPSADPEITAANITDVPAIGVTDAEWAYTVSNFTDDVEVKEFTGCVTAATASAGIIKYSVAANYFSSASIGTIVIWSASNHEVTKSISVSQLFSSLAVSSAEVIIPADETTATFTVTTPGFGYDAVVATTVDGMNLSISAGASGNASTDAQTVTVSSTTEATSEVQTLGTITVYRNSNDSDPQLKTVTIKKASNSVPGTKSLKIDFESAASSYTDWTITTIKTQSTNTNVPAHGGSYYGGTDGKTTGSIVTKTAIANPQSITFYVSKESTNTKASSWFVEVSADGSNWTQVGDAQSASSMDKGNWVEVTRDLSSNSDVYVRIRYNGTSAKRCIDDVELVYE